MFYVILFSICYVLLSMFCVINFPAFFTSTTVSIFGIGTFVEFKERLYFFALEASFHFFGKGPYKSH